MNKEAAVALIVKDGLILGVSRKQDRTKFGLPGGKVDEGEAVTETLKREVMEETGIKAINLIPVYTRTDTDPHTNESFMAYSYYVVDWEGEPIPQSNEGDIAWLTVKELTETKAAFPDYNIENIRTFKEMFPNITLINE